MKKIPTLFERVYENHKVVDVLPNVTEGMQWVLDGEGIATVKIDGSCCAIINGEFYKRYDAKKGKKPPVGAIPCCEPDEITGHHPHWVKVDKNNPADMWFCRAYYVATDEGLVKLEDGTYEAIGKHFNGNPYNKKYDTLVKHGEWIINESYLERTFEGIKDWLWRNCDKEGIVFWKDGEPKCKIKRTDFGFEWNGK